MESPFKTDTDQLNAAPLLSTPTAVLLLWNLKKNCEDVDREFWKQDIYFYLELEVNDIRPVSGARLQMQK